MSKERELRNIDQLFADCGNGDSRILFQIQNCISGLRINYD